MADVLHPRQASRVPIGWDEIGQGYRAPTLRVSAVDNEFEMRVHDADLAAALTGGGLVEKETLADVTTVVIGGAGNTWVTPVVDLASWPFVAVSCVSNTGPDIIAFGAIMYEEATFAVALGLAPLPSVAAGANFYVQSQGAGAGWLSTITAQAVFGAIRVRANAPTNNATVRVLVLGMRH